MAVQDLAIHQITRNGISPTYVAVDTDGATMVNDGVTVLDIWNVDGSGSITVTVIIQQTVEGQTVPPKTYTVPNTTTAHGDNQLIIGPFPTATYNNASGKVVLDVSATGCQMAAIRS